jgi:hypothetical protein
MSTPEPQTHDPGFLVDRIDRAGGNEKVPPDQNAGAHCERIWHPLGRAVKRAFNVSDRVALDIGDHEAACPFNDVHRLENLVFGIRRHRGDDGRSIRRSYGLLRSALTKPRQPRKCGDSAPSGANRCRDCSDRT